MANLIHRFRLRFVWLLTRHPRFRPLYHADLVHGDLLAQAEFLASAGYYVAAAMLARLAVESRVKRLAMITKEWREFTKKMTVATMAHKLCGHGRISLKAKRKIEFLYDRASRVAHGDQVAAERCLEVLALAAEVAQTLDNLITQDVRSSCPQQIVAA